MKTFLDLKKLALQMRSKNKLLVKNNHIEIQIYESDSVQIAVSCNNYKIKEAIIKFEENSCNDFCVSVFDEKLKIINHSKSKTFSPHDNLYVILQKLPDAPCIDTIVGSLLLM